MPKTKEPVQDGIPDAENPEWTKEMFDRSKRFEDLPASLQAKLSAIQKASRKRRGLQKAPTKVLTSIRLSSDVIDALRATGRGWQSTVDATLRRQFVKKSRGVGS
jgi:uncharacterized protein (DUF4415 family)